MLTPILVASRPRRGEVGQSHTGLRPRDADGPDGLNWIRPPVRVHLSTGRAAALPWVRSARPGWTGTRRRGPEPREELPDGLRGNGVAEVPDRTGRVLRGADLPG